MDATEMKRVSGNHCPICGGVIMPGEKFCAQQHEMDDDAPEDKEAK